MHNFKSGIYHLAKKMPQVEFVPVYVKNAHRVLPKGEFLPVPTLCSVTFGAPFRFEAGLDKFAFLTRAKNAIEQLNVAA
jgi:1-acyl-sn-glycerol-3-phosphate acyltransferase